MKKRLYLRLACYSLTLLCVLFLNLIDVNALTWSNTSVRTAYWYANGTLYDDGFISTTPRSLPQSPNNAGAVSLRLYQWRYTSSSYLSKGRYRILTDITFSSLDGNDINNFLSPVVDEIRCGTSYSNQSADNLSLVNYKLSKVSDVKFQFEYTIDVLYDNTCNFFAGILKYEPNSYNSDYMVNYSETSNKTISYYTTYQVVEVTSNQDIIDSIDKGTQDIIDNNNQNTQDIIDSQDKINDAITSEDEDFESGSCGIICKLKKLPSMIVDGIKSLFVPDSEELNTLIDDFKNTMSEKLGVIYQAGELIIDIFQGIIDDSTPENACLTFPEIKVPNVDQAIVQETKFCFNEITDEIPILLTTIRGISGIFITLMFVNMLKKRYDTFVNGGDL